MMTKRDYTKTYAKRTKTTERHARMRCVTRELRIKTNTQTKRDYLNRIFAEGKWVYNHYLQLHKDNKLAWSRMPTSDNGVIVKYPLGWETRTLYAISSAMKQGIRDRLKANEKSLVTNIKEENIAHGEMRT